VANRKDKTRNSNQGSVNLIQKRLPYEFVPFDKDQYRFPYAASTSPDGGKMLLPRHDRVERERLSGELRYKITPHSDLVIEIREKYGGGHFISGSVVRGKFRSNVEMLSRSYPEFVNRAPLMYRDIQSNDYKKQLFGLKKSDQESDQELDQELDLKEIEHYIRVGFLHKSDGKFFIVPAEKFGDKYFLSIPEHRLRKMEVGRCAKSSLWLYYWNDEIINQFERLQQQIDQLTREIKKLREPYRQILKDCPMSRWFSNCMAFTKMREDINATVELLKSEKKEISDEKEIANELIECRRDHLNELTNLFIEENGLSDSQAADIKEIYKKTFERWQLKWELENQYKSNGKRNENFKPYQLRVSYDLDDSVGVRDISLNINKYKRKGYLFNSTNASSKRSHYLVGGPNLSESVLHIKDEVINAYNRNLGRMRFPQVRRGQDLSEQERRELIKDFIRFYSLFDRYDELSNKDEPIIFYRTEINEKTTTVADLGRTPYMKIFYETKPEHLLGSKPANSVDYAGALFGYVDSSSPDSSSRSYKSRLIFRPVEIKGDPGRTRKVRHFILMTPQPTASGMYLRQDGTIKKTYADPASTLEFNGLKYYHVRKSQREPSDANKQERFSSARYVYGANCFEELSGTVAFKNLTRAEMGLLLLAADIRLIRQSKFWEKVRINYSALQVNEHFLDRCYELIGGAKPYGYGKVTIDVLDLRLEDTDYDFEKLMLGNAKQEPQEKWKEYIDAFLEDMGGEAFIKSALFGAYLISKSEMVDDEFGEDDIKDWDYFVRSSKDKNGRNSFRKKKPKTPTGYKKNWILKRRFNM
jgi:CRISPR-associated protein (TIGR03986 family)